MSEEAKKEKQVVIDEIKAKLEGAQSAVVIDYMGTTVAEADAMRKKLREADVDYSVYKNTLMKRAIAGTEFEKLGDVMQGPSAIAISKDDATAPARVLKEAITSYKKMEFKAGIVEGEFYDKDGIEQIASIPSRDELIAKFMGSIQSPIGKFVRTLAAIAEAKPADGAEAPAAEAAPAEAPAEAAPAEAPAEEAPAAEATPDAE
ncbi:50S ribosomal protein L10 [Aminicella lysinilytica]|uniref:Large ribosomal subunit protein uL10 n=1 Tax=Aminicella lysinilytica TaxID=433323 RepID=A0A4R6Q654_9FIRM|nr:50S ribosomal protein L10 [Aminicella lysinilytica]NLD11460.1 50S ribosomal protein L10 [Clostridiales bacterium]TDP57721.1 LSU ribosomal protein L10P [Aminicella lysinilytica]